MSTISTDTQVMDLPASRVRGSRPVAASYALAVDAQPRLLAGPAAPQHLAASVMCTWRPTAAQVRGTCTAERTHHVGRVAAIGGAFVPANQKKFETRSGPGSCSPPA